MANTYTSAYTGAQIDAALKLLTDSSVANRIIIKPGDQITVSGVMCPGYLSSDAKNAVFTMFTNKIILATGVTCSQIKGNMRHADGGYIFGSYNSSGNDWTTGFALDAKIREGGVQFSLTHSTSQGTNNVPITAYLATVTLTFS